MCFAPTLLLLGAPTKTCLESRTKKLNPVLFTGKYSIKVTAVTGTDDKDLTDNGILAFSKMFNVLAKDYDCKAGTVDTFEP